jgi:hypothetical protein
MAAARYTTICKVAALLTRFQKDPVSRNGRLKTDRKGLKFARADVALVDARASRGRKARMLFEEDGLFSKWHPGGRCFGPGVVVTLQSK